VKKHPLDRLLRLRALLEDIGRMELEMRLQELGQIERALTQRMADRKNLRAQSFAGFAHADNAIWTEAEVMHEWSQWEQGILARAHQKKMVEVGSAEESYLERRKERRQVERVIEDHAATATTEQNRRRQRELDDWFAQRSR
jgi:flagellar biosynthesis chaperone FliJ